VQYQYQYPSYIAVRAPLPLKENAVLCAVLGLPGLVARSDPPGHIPGTYIIVPMPHASLVLVSLGPLLQIVMWCPVAVLPPSLLFLNPAG
jgi:hypothetical protein